jgi:hypothetical protein
MGDSKVQEFPDIPERATRGKPLWSERIEQANGKVFPDRRAGFSSGLTS